MSQDATAVNIALQNPALALIWEDGVLQVENRLSGQSRAFDFPAFAIKLAAEELAGDDFALTDVQAGADEVTFSYRHEPSGIGVQVRYWLEGDKPWFRKQLTLTAPDGTPTLDRVWVDLQSDPPGPVRRVGYGLRGGPDAEQQSGLDTYADQPGCGFPVYAGDWFFGIEHAAAFTVPGERLEIYHHPI